MQKSVTSRQQQMLEVMLNSREALSIDQLSAVLEISRTAVQQHITVLQRDGYIKNGQAMKSAGRPIQTFELTECGVHLFTKQYSWFSGLLLDELKQQLGADGLKHYLNKLGIRQAQQLLGQLEGLSATEKLEAISKVMQEMGYEATTQAQDGDQLPIINACNCVYHDLAKQFPEVCQFDHALLTTLSGHDVDLIECIAEGGCACRFKFTKKD